MSAFELVDRFAPADDAAQLAGDRARPCLERGVGQHLVGLHRARAERREAEREREEGGAHRRHSAGTAERGGVDRAGAPTR